MSGGRRCAAEKSGDEDEEQECVRDVKGEIAEMVRSRGEPGERIGGRETEPAERDVAPHVAEVGEHPFEIPGCRRAEVWVDEDVVFIVPRQEIELEYVP